MTTTFDSSIDVFDAMSLKDHQRHRAAKAWAKGNKARQNKVQKFIKDPVERERLLAIQQRRLKKRGSDDEDSDASPIDSEEEEEGDDASANSSSNEDNNDDDERKATTRHRARNNSCSRTGASAGSDSDASVASTSSGRSRRANKKDNKKNKAEKNTTIKTVDASNLEQALRSKKRANRRGNDDELIEQLEKLEVEAAVKAVAKVPTDTKLDSEKSEMSSGHATLLEEEEKISFQHNVNFSTKDQTMASHSITLGEWRDVIEKKLEAKVQ